MIREKIWNFFRKRIVDKLNNEFKQCTFDMEVIHEEDTGSKYIQVTCIACTPLSERDIEHITIATDSSVYSIEEHGDCTKYTFRSY